MMYTLLGYYSRIRVSLIFSPQTYLIIYQGIEDTRVLLRDFKMHAWKRYTGDPRTLMPRTIDNYMHAHIYKGGEREYSPTRSCENHNTPWEQPIRN